jgi:hypothetical protein
MRVFRRLCWLGAMLALLGYSGVAFARQDDDSTRISYGEVIEGFLDETDFRDLFVFAGRQGEVITITMTVIDGDLDPFISLENSGRTSRLVHEPRLQ